MTGLVTITSKNQITLPLAIVKALGIKKGDKLLFTTQKTGKKMIVFAQPVPDILSLYGSMRSKAHQPYTLKDEMRVARQAAAKHIAKEGLK